MVIQKAELFLNLSGFFIAIIVAAPNDLHAKILKGMPKQRPGAIILFNNGEKTVIQEKNPTFASLKASIENWIEGKEEAVAAETVDREL